MNPYRTHNCGELRKEHVNKAVRIAGWIDTIRDHGGVIFIDLRDHYGITQIVLSENARAAAAKLSRESVISAEGILRERDPDTVNSKIDTGFVEVRADKIELLGRAYYPAPFEICDSSNTREEVRLRYRYLDLRNPALHSIIVLRSQVISFLRRKMEELGFVEIQTPILTSSSPEGARDYLVPSRKFRGKFYALPQAPQQFKQLLMTAGFDRYFQIAPCFRDEDARSDRSPGEFYQLDFEMAFATQEDVFEVAEIALSEVFRKFALSPIPGCQHRASDVKTPEKAEPVITPLPFPRITYSESMMKYGTDKPDLRNPLIIKDLSDFFQNVDFAPFRAKPVRGIVAGACASKSKAFFEKMLSFATEIGMKGLGYISVFNGMELKGPIVKFLSAQKRSELIETLDLKADDTLFFISDQRDKVDRLAGQIRSELGLRLGIIDESRFEFAFITDFPMYELSEDTGRIQFTHNPFSMPKGEMEALETMDPLDVNAYQYDIVLNGVELSSGAVRNHRPDIMIKAFEIAGYEKKDIEEKFSALFEAFHYGAPPHAGMAPGIDRMLMLMTGSENIREVIAFPMNSNGQDLLINAPAAVSEHQLREVHVKLR
ncbi:MAG: aspartate--tRNA ligase [Clostridiales bacterium]|jgi:aspartyl-tRNA synthetase|nr:aspartate--tRNA ligase [Clostridiales bacterium]